MCDDSVMKRSTAMSRLSDVVDGLYRAAKWPGTTVTAAYVFGALLEGDAGLERVDVALVVAERRGALYPALPCVQGIDGGRQCDCPHGRSGPKRRTDSWLSTTNASRSCRSC